MKITVGDTMSNFSNRVHEVPTLRQESCREGNREGRATKFRGSGRSLGGCGHSLEGTVKTLAHSPSCFLAMK